MNKTYQPQDFKQLLGMKGFSDKMLINHFKLYEAYVKNTNTLLEKMTDLESKGERESPYYSELKRRFGWEFDGMRLHEYYFGNMGTRTTAPDGSVKKLIEKSFGSFEAWKTSFLSMGAMRGIGWVLLIHDVAADRAMNIWVEEHHIGHCVDTHPLLVMDVFEHAFITDYGLEKKKYIEAFYSNINWNTVARRLK